MSHSAISAEEPASTPGDPPSPSNIPTLFEQASRVFDGWTDPDTGLAVLRLTTPERLHGAGLTDDALRTLYHQSNPFLRGGRTVLLRRPRPRRERQRTWDKPRDPEERRRARLQWLPLRLDLTTGNIGRQEDERYLLDHREDAGTALFMTLEHEAAEVVLVDLRANAVLAAHRQPEWHGPEARLLADGRRAVLGYIQGRPYDEPCRARHFLLDADGDVRLLHEADGCLCNHLQANPVDPNLYAYDRWPTPKRYCEQVIHIAAVDGSHHAPLPLLDGAVRPGTIWGGQRDHYLWTPDGTRIASYVSPLDMPESGDHYDFGWWVSVTDWRTGEDLCAEYPPDRWGGNFQISPDSRFIVSAGGRGFQCIYLIEIEGLRQGWNERVLCHYPVSVEDGFNDGPFHMPFALPDQSGVIFTAGWPGPDDGVYLVEWPADIR